MTRENSALRWSFLPFLRCLFQGRSSMGFVACFFAPASVCSRNLQSNHRLSVSCHRDVEEEAISSERRSLLTCSYI